MEVRTLPVPICVVNCCVVFALLLGCAKSAKKPAIVAILHIKRDEGTGPSRSEGYYDSYRETQATLLKSRIVIASALRSSEINQISFIRSREEPVDWVWGLVKVDVPPNSHLIRVKIPLGN